LFVATLLTARRRLLVQKNFRRLCPTISLGESARAIELSIAKRKYCKAIASDVCQAPSTNRRVASQNGDELAKDASVVDHDWLTCLINAGEQPAARHHILFYCFNFFIWGERYLLNDWRVLRKLQMYLSTVFA